MTEQVQVREFGQPLPLEIHAHWRFSAEEYGAYEVRVVVCASSGEERFSDAIQLQVNTPRHRVRVRGTPAFVAPGDYRILVECRRQGTTNGWTRSECYWPLLMELIQ